MQNLKRIVIGVVGLAFALLLLSAVTGAEIDTTLQLGIIGVVLVITGGVAMLRKPFIALGVFALLVILVVIVVNINGIIEGAGSVLTFIFEPNTRVTTEVVNCRDDAGCSGVYPIIFSALLLFVVITGFAYTTLLERRFISWFQHRVGPNRVGPKGLLQPLADAIKLIFKEDIEPTGASRVVWFLSPMIKAVPTLVVLAVIPLGPDLLIPWFAPALGDVWFRVPLSLADPNVGVLWLLAITSIGTYGIVLAGWSSNNKYAMLGGLRATSQMISYELSLGLTMAVPVLIVGSMSLGDIINGQVMIWEWFVFQNPLAAGILFVALLAEVNRAPFDLPEAEQELTAGYMTEYSGMKFALFMMAEYLGMIAISLILASLFFGGYQDGFGLVSSIPALGPLVMIGKVVLLLIFMVWIRATLPRIRYDRLMYFGWKILLPLALVAVMWTAVALVIGDVFNSPVVYGVVSGLLFGAVVVGSFVYLSRAGRTEDEDDDPANDPIITGERRGAAYAGLQVVGALIAIPFGLYNFTIRQLDGLASLGKPQEEGLVVKDDTSASVQEGSGD